MTKRALEGVRIADFGWVYASPYTAMLLSLLGADVVKVESYKRVDQTRESSAPVVNGVKDIDASPVYNSINLNKRSVTINFKTPEGVELAKQFIASCDVVVENMRPGVMDRLGLGYEDLVKVKPDIIMLSASGFGSGGPYGHFAGYAPIFASFGGMGYITGYKDGQPNTGFGDMDLRAGNVAAASVLMALINLKKTGKGMHIDLSSSECVADLVGSELLEYSLNKRSPSRCGNEDAIMAPHQVYRCKGEDSWVSIAVATDEEWKAMRGAMGDPDWAKDPVYDDAFSRWQHRYELDRHVTEWTKGHTDYEVTRMLQAVGVAAFPSMTVEELINDEHTVARGNMAQLDHPLIGKRTVVGVPWKFSETPAGVYHHAPLMGAANEEIFCGRLGMSKEQFDEYVEKQIIY